MLLLVLVASASCCSPGTPFYPKDFKELPKWIEDTLALSLTTTTATTTTEEPILPTPEALVEVTSPTGQTTTLTWKQISVQQQNNYRPGADSFSGEWALVRTHWLQRFIVVWNSRTCNIWWQWSPRDSVLPGSDRVLLINGERRE